MSGHSKWSTIKRKKGAADAKRSKMFSKIVKDITVAVNNIERAISKGKDKDAANFLELTYEGYLAHGIAVYIECTTDNQQRTVSAVRAVFNKYTGNLGTNGSLSFLFDRKGIFTVPKGELDAEEFELEMIDAGAEDIEEEDGFFSITTALEDFGNMQKKLEEMGIEPESAELQRIPHETVKLDIEGARKILKVVEVFEDDDDVQKVFHNLEITDELMAEM
jgi:YebC/PmpR family DNA-binding regulatory protein